MNLKYLTVLLAAAMLTAGGVYFSGDEDSNFLAGSGSPGDFCYQETANVSTACGGLDTGVYYAVSTWSNPVNFTFDGLWTSGASSNWTTPESSLYINYSIPYLSASSSLWQVKYGDPTGPFPSVTENITINDSCWAQNPIQLMMISNNTCATCEHIRLQCYNGSDFILMKYINQSDDAPFLYEEAMWWDWVDDTANVTFCGTVNSVLFKTNISRGNYSASKNTYTEYNVIPENQSTSGCTYIINNTNATNNQEYVVTSSVNNEFIVIMANNNIINNSLNYTYNVSAGELWTINLTMNITLMLLNKTNETFSINVTKV